ncbi:hypothetical protein [Desulfobulbus alkaliphilus]|uniref:hypothetical protein n=1 Tax=Desulfobulbus alkaliphilus TaxID=869814 RepID=UPI001966B144|nr:hypothetical protein [Desulfobulbus alkaliphilus]MBM9536575.1 hypothetical protein [Desulfobulbus alkaliphilus]
MRTHTIMITMIIIGLLPAVGVAAANDRIQLGPPVVVDGSPEAATTAAVEGEEPSREATAAEPGPAAAATSGEEAAPAASEPLERVEEVVAVNIEEPRPILLDQDGTVAATDRDPFADPPSRRVFEAGYGKVVDSINLQGIIRVGERQVGLFAVDGGSGGRDQGRLRQVEVGEPLRFFIGATEYRFTVAQLEERSAVLIGENNEDYKVWL